MRTIENGESSQETRRSGVLDLPWFSLESLPEIEREEVLAGRLEEMQKYKDSQQLDAMLGMAGMGEPGDDDDEEDEDGRSRKKRGCTLPAWGIILNRTQGNIQA
jgi:hypothetical protein